MKASSFLSRESFLLLAARTTPVVLLLPLQECSIPESPVLAVQPAREQQQPVAAAQRVVGLELPAQKLLSLRQQQRLRWSIPLPQRNYRGPSLYFGKRTTEMVACMAPGRCLARMSLAAFCCRRLGNGECCRLQPNLAALALVSYMPGCLTKRDRLATARFAESIQLERLVAPALQWGSAMNLSPAACLQCLLGLLVAS